MAGMSGRDGTDTETACNPADSLERASSGSGRRSSMQREDGRRFGRSSTSWQRTSLLAHDEPVAAPRALESVRPAACPELVELAYCVCYTNRRLPEELERALGYPAAAAAAAAAGLRARAV